MSSTYSTYIYGIYVCNSSNSYISIKTFAVIFNIANTILICYVVDIN